jgi:HTH-type transcriptional regulator/antitoxin HipB
MSYPIRVPDQLKQHLRALRKSHGLTQSQLGALVGVKQARMAEIEANPGAVSLDQLTKILAVLGGTLHLHTATVQPKALAKPPKKAPARKPPDPSPTRSTTNLVIRPKKGAW